MPTVTPPAAMIARSLYSHSGRFSAMIETHSPRCSPRATSPEATSRTRWPYSRHEISCQRPSAFLRRATLSPYLSTCRQNRIGTVVTSTLLIPRLPSRFAVCSRSHAHPVRIAAELHLSDHLPGRHIDHRKAGLAARKQLRVARCRLAPKCYDRLAAIGGKGKLSGLSPTFLKI